MISDGKQCSFVRQIDVDFSCFTIVLGRGMRPNIRFAALCADRFRPQTGFAVGTVQVAPGFGVRPERVWWKGLTGPRLDQRQSAYTHYNRLADVDKVLVSKEYSELLAHYCKSNARVCIWRNNQNIFDRLD